MTRRAEKRRETQAGSEATGTVGDVPTALGTGMTAPRARVLEWVQGLVALQEVCAAEVETVAAPKGKRKADRT